MPKIKMDIFSEVVREWEEAAHGRKGAVLKQRLPLLGISEGTFYRKRQKHFGKSGRKTPTTKGQRKRPEYVDAVKKIMMEKYLSKKVGQRLTTAQAQVLAAQKGCELAATIPKGTVNRIAREMWLQPRVPRRQMGTLMVEDKIFRRFADRVGYRDGEREQIQEGDPRLRQIRQLARAAARYSIAAEVVKARHCNSGYQVGDRFILDLDGNFLTKLCPPRLCVYLISQLAVPVALINERLSEGLDPNQFHFMHQVRCLDVGVECGGYGEVMLEIKVVPRIKGSPASIPD